VGPPAGGVDLLDCSFESITAARKHGHVVTALGEGALSGAAHPGRTPVTTRPSGIDGTSRRYLPVMDFPARPSVKQ
jgi:hypothetical protein